MASEPSGIDHLPTHWPTGPWVVYIGRDRVHMGVSNMSAGIDYGRGMTNIDAKTGIRYGVIPQNDILDAWADSSELVYPSPACGPDPEWRYHTRGGYGTITFPDGQEVFLQGEEASKLDDAVEACETDEAIAELLSDYENCAQFPESEPIGSKCTDGFYDAACGDSGDIFVTRSPYYTLARFCSPCAPGAGDLSSPDPDGVKTYCFGHDWFDGGTAPYPVYSVETGQLVNPE